MRLSTVLLLCLGLLASACRAQPQERQYTLKGQILGISRNRLEATIKHEEIKGLMQAMTMPYRVKDAKEFEGLAPGDLITATLVVVSNDAHLTNLKKTGTAPLDPSAPQPPSASSHPPNITHTLRTAIIDPGGRLVEVHTGNDWTPTRVVADLKPIAAETD